MTQVYHNIVKIYTAFSQSEKLPYLVKMLYLFMRSRDSQLFVKRHKRGEAGKGSGKVVLDIPMLSRTFKRSIATIKKNLRLALKLGVFWMLEIKGDEVLLVLQSWAALGCQSCLLNSVLNCCEVRYGLKDEDLDIGKYCSEIEYSLVVRVLNSSPWQY